MSFGEKLTKLRKEKGMSQEELANNLNVSRQAVSKWESNNSYPETEKIIAICKLFDCSMDELIGLKDSKTKKENKVINVFNEYFEMFIKGIKMFYGMTFKQKIKCLIEMGFYVIILIIMFLIFTNIFSEIISKLLYLLPDELLIILIQVFEGLFYLIYLIFGIYVLVKLYRIRYLDYYELVFNSDNNIEEEKNGITNNKKIKIKEEKIIIRDSSEVFKPLSWIKKVCVIILKCITIFLSMTLAIIFIILIACTIFLLSFMKNGVILIYISVIIIGVILIIYIILEMLVKFLFNMIQKSKKLFILFIIALIIVGISSGLFLYELSNYKIVNDVEYNKINEINIKMKDNLIIEYIDYYDTEIIIEDREDIYIEFYGYDKNLIDVSNYNEVEEITGYNLYEIQLFHIKEKNIKEFIDKMLESIKDKKIIISDIFYTIKPKIHISQENYNKLRNNEKMRDKYYGECSYYE